MISEVYEHVTTTDQVDHHLHREVTIVAETIMDHPADETTTMVAITVVVGHDRHMPAVIVIDIARGVQAQDQEKLTRTLSSRFPDAHLGMYLMYRSY